MHSRTPITSSLVLILLACTNSPIGAQETPLRTGDRVRVTYYRDRSQTTTGTLLAADQQSLTLSVSGSSNIQFRRTDVTTLEVSRGRRSKIATKALIGGLVGFGTGFAIVYAAAEPEFNDHDFNRGGIALAGGALGAGAGLLIGAIIGVSTKRDVWEEVPLDGLRVGLTSLQRGRLNFRISYRLGLGP